MPELRIVDEALLAAAHARLERARADYKRTLGGQIVGQPHIGAERRDGKHLLSGLVECALCHGAMHAVRRSSRTARHHYYVCDRWRVAHRCENAMAAPLERLHTAVVEKLREDILAPDVVAAVVERAMVLAEQARVVARDARGEMEAELARLGTELKRYAEAIATSGPIPAILDAIKVREQRRVEITGQLARLSVAPATPGRVRDLRALLERKLDDWQALLERHAVEARATVIRPLLASRIVMVPTITAAGRFYEFSAPVTYGGLLQGLLPTVSRTTRAR